MAAPSYAPQSHACKCTWPSWSRLHTGCGTNTTSSSQCHCTPLLSTSCSEWSRLAIQWSGWNGQRLLDRPRPSEQTLIPRRRHPERAPSRRGASRGICIFFLKRHPSRERSERGGSRAGRLVSGHGFSRAASPEGDIWVSPGRKLWEKAQRKLGAPSRGDISSARTSVRADQLPERNQFHACFLKRFSRFSRRQHCQLLRPRLL